MISANFCDTLTSVAPLWGWHFCFFSVKHFNNYYVDCHTDNHVSLQDEFWRKKKKRTIPDGAWASTSNSPSIWYFLQFGIYFAVSVLLWFLGRSSTFQKHICFWCNVYLLPTWWFYYQQTEYLEGITLVCFVVYDADTRLRHEDQQHELRSIFFIKPLSSWCDYLSDL